MHQNRKWLAPLYLSLTFIVPYGTSRAETPQMMMAQCRERAHKALNFRLPDIEVKYEGQRTDGTHAVNGTARSNEREETFQCSFNKSGSHIVKFVVNTPAETSPSHATGKPESDCLAAVANEVGNGDVSIIDIKHGENQIKVRVRVPGAQAPWICDHDSKKVTNVYYGAEG